MKRHAGHPRIGGSRHLDLPADRTPLPSMGNTEWDKWARHEQRRQRVGMRLVGVKREGEEEVVPVPEDAPRCPECGCTMQSKTCGQLHYSYCPVVKR